MRLCKYKRVAGDACAKQSGKAQSVSEAASLPHKRETRGKERSKCARRNPGREREKKGEEEEEEEEGG